MTAPKFTLWECFSAALVVAFLCFCVFGAAMGYKQSTEFRQRCEAAGGVPFQPKRDWVCLRREQVVRLP